jgi:hypothetical protein
MKKFAIAALAVSLSLGTMTAITAPAQAQGFAFSFDTGDVHAAYRDGYWDRNRQWHAWRDAREARAYREAYCHRYYPYPRHYYRNMGWRDRDGDGIPNRLDSRPNNPYRP